MKRLLVCVVLAFGGCARTSLVTPIASYASDKDVAIEGLKFKMTKPDGTVIEAEVKRWGGNASGVDAIQADSINKALDLIPRP